MELKPKDEIIDAWINALRSGEYKQGHSVLRRAGSYGGDEFCCLGVLCEVAGLPKIRIHQGFQYVWPGGNEDYSTTQLPLGLARYLGMSIAGSIPSRSGQMGHASVMGENDTSRATFAEIADIIEKHRGEMFSIPPERAHQE